MPEANLFPRETIIDRHRGTLFIFPDQLGIRSIDLANKAKHPVGGTLFLTQYRLVFEAHPLNAITGATSILYDTIQSARDTSVFMQPQFAIKAGTDYEFLFFNVERPLSELKLALRQATPTSNADARQWQLRAALPDIDDRPPRAIVRAILDKVIASPGTILRVLTLHNLWLSLGNA